MPGADHQTFVGPRRVFPPHLRHRSLNRFGRRMAREWLCPPGQVVGTRRGALEQLVRADASITELADKFHMTLTGMKKHVGVLEQAGLVTTEKVGRVRTCKLGRRRLEEEAMWIETYRQLWDARFDELDKVVEELKRKEKADGRRKR